MKKFKISNILFPVVAICSVLLALSSCTNISSNESESGAFSFSLTPEVFRTAVANSSRNYTGGILKSETETYTETMKYSVEVSLQGEYTASKTIEKTVTKTFIHSANGESNEYADFETEVIKFDDIPVGKTVYVDLRIYGSHMGNEEYENNSGTESKSLLLKGKSDKITIRAGLNTAVVKAYTACYAFPFEITLNFGDDNMNNENVVNGMYIMAFKSNCDYVKALREADDGHDDSVLCELARKYTEYMGNANDSWLGSIYCYKIDDSGNFEINGEKAVVTDTMYLPVSDADPTKGEELTLVVVKAVENLGAGTTTVYFGGLWDSDENELVITPVKKTTTKVSTWVGRPHVLSTQYVLYQKIGTSYQYSLASSAAQTGTLLGTSAINTFCFDNDGYFYFIGVSGEKYSIKSNRSDFSEVVTNITYDSNFNNLPTMAIDRKTNILYLAENAGVYDLVLTKYPNLVSKGTADSSCMYRHEKTSDNYLFMKGCSFAINNDIAYFPINSNNNTEPKQLYKVDLSTAVSNGEYYRVATEYGNKIDLTTDSTVASMLVSASITDMLYQDGAVYMIVREYNPGSTGASAYSRGVIIKYDVSSGTCTNMELAPTKTVTTFKSACSANTSVVYNTSDTTDYYIYEFTCGSSPSEINFYTTFNNLNSYLAGPQKFIAIKPKKLVISDTGIAFYTTADGVISYKNVNRVVEVDLSTLSISDKTDVNVEFEASTTYSSNNTSGLPVKSGVVLTEKYKGSDLVQITSTSGQVICPYFAKDL